MDSKSKKRILTNVDTIVMINAKYFVVYDVVGK